MGSVHSDMEKRTLKEWASASGIKPDSARVKASRTFRRAIGQMTVLTADEWAKVYGDKTSTVQRTEKPDKDKSVSKSIPVAANALPPGKHESKKMALPSLSQVRDAMLDLILVGIPIGHAGLVWYDCAALWHTPGAIGGCIAFLIIVATVMLSADETKNITSQYALLITLVVDAAAWWVHYPVFEKYNVDATTTGVLCAFLCGMSWASLSVYRHKKNY